LQAELLSARLSEVFYDRPSERSRAPTSGGKGVNLESDATPMLGDSPCSDNCRFSSHDEYIKWCEAMVTKIYYAQIAMNDQPIRDVVAEIGSKLWLQEGVELFPYPNS